MKRMRAIFLCIALLALFSACQQRQDAKVWADWERRENWEEKGYNTFCGLEWGMSEDEIVRSLGLKEGDYTRSQSSGETNDSIYLQIEKEEPIFGVTARVANLMLENMSQYNGKEGSYGLVQVRIIYTSVTEEESFLVRRGMHEIYGLPDPYRVELDNSYGYDSDSRARTITPYRKVEIPKGSKSEYWNGTSVYESMGYEIRERYLEIFRDAREKLKNKWNEQTKQDLLDNLEICPASQIIYASPSGEFINSYADQMESAINTMELPILSVDFYGHYIAYGKAVEESLKSKERD